MKAISKKVRAPDLALMKERGERIVMLTAYDATMARLFDQASVDLLLVGDSLGHVILGLESTIPVTLDQIIHHTRAVAKGATRSLVVADMPFLTYQISSAEGGVRWQKRYVGSQRPAFPSWVMPALRLSTFIAWEECADRRAMKRRRRN
jgi:ketopantoate hydroxymethyltransferase